MEKRTIAATLECAGNNRIFLEPKVKGVQWELGAVGNAKWTGVPLSAVLARAKPKTGAIEVILDGADEGEVDKTPTPSGKISFSRSLPLAKACHDVLLAYEMNGEKLSASHGFPLRAIVPGWYAMASVKWLTAPHCYLRAIQRLLPIARLFLLGSSRTTAQSRPAERAASESGNRPTGKWRDRARQFDRQGSRRGLELRCGHHEGGNQRSIPARPGMKPNFWMTL